MVGIVVILAGIGTLYFRRPLTRYLMRVQERQWGLQFDEGEPRTWYVTFAGLVLLCGGALVMWKH